MKVGVVGTGMVGATAAYALVMQGVGREVVLVDKNRERAAAEADDIRHAVPFAHQLEIRAGDYGDLDGCKVVILTAGANQHPGEKRLDLQQKNAAVFMDIVPRVVAAAPDAVLLVATNPVDVMTHLTARIAAKAGLPAGRVIGSGTTLDTARFRSLLGQRLGVDPHHIHAYVVGEHGDSEVLAWSSAGVSAIPVDEYARHRGRPLDDAARAEIDDRVRNAAYSIIKGKHATYYGIGSALSRVTSVLLRDQRSVFTVCAPADEVAGVKDVTVSLPRLIGGAGVLDTIPLPMTAAEHAALAASARVIRAAIDKLPSI